MELHHRPQYHFMPLANWMNDPNGLIQWQGVYHLFYQHNPHGADWGDMHWGHASSPDLVHWQHLPIALAPTPGGPDKDGVFSGCAVNNDGTPTLVYTGVRPEVQCLATSDDGLITWQKDARSPVIAGPPGDFEPTGFRDPYVWRDNDAWYMVLGSGTRAQGGMVLLYRSPDLVSWEYLGPLYEASTQAMGYNWECPNFVALHDAHLLIISPQPFREAHYFIGDYGAHRFSPRRQGLLDYGGLYYAPQVFVDDAGRRICFGWLLEGRSREACLVAGWAGVESLPRELTLDEAGALRQRPVPELEGLRRMAFSVEGQSVGAPEMVPDLVGDSLEIEMIIDMHRSDSVVIDVRRSPDGEERTRIEYEHASNRLLVDTRRSSLDPAAEGRLTDAPLDLQGGRLSLRLFLDRSVIEIFANETVCATARVYPTRDDSLGIALGSKGGEARLTSLRAWQLDSIWAQSGAS